MMPLGQGNVQAVIRPLLQAPDKCKGWDSQKANDSPREGTPPAPSFPPGALRVKNNESWLPLFPREAPETPGSFSLPSSGLSLGPWVGGVKRRGAPSSRTSGPAGGAGRLECSPQNSEFFAGRAGGAEGRGQEWKLHRRSRRGSRCREGRRAQPLPVRGLCASLARGVP